MAILAAWDLAGIVFTVAGVIGRHVKMPVSANQRKTRGFMEMSLVLLLFGYKLDD